MLTALLCAITLLCPIDAAHGGESGCLTPSGRRLTPLAPERLPEGEIKMPGRPYYREPGAPPPDTTVHVAWDDEAQVYRIRWRGEPFRQWMSVEYEPLHLLTVCVEARVEAAPSGDFQYTYWWHRTPDSRQRLSMVVLAASPECAVASGLSANPVLRITKHARDSAILDLYAIGFQGGFERHPEMADRWGPMNFTCGNPPDIVPCFAKGFAPALRSPQELPEHVEALFPPGVDRQGLFGKTVGPGPALGADPAALCARVARIPEQIDEAAGLGWLPGEGAADALRGLAARCAEGCGERPAADTAALLRELEAATRRLAAMDPPAATPEAEALFALTPSLIAERLEGFGKK